MVNLTKAHLNVENEFPNLVFTRRLSITNGRPVSQSKFNNNYVLE